MVDHSRQMPCPSLPLRRRVKTKMFVDTPRSSRGIQMLKRWILTRMKKKNEARLYMSLMESLDSRISLPSMSPVPSHQQERMTGKRELRRWL